MGLGLLSDRSRSRAHHLSNVYIVDNDWLLVEIDLANLMICNASGCVNIPGSSLKLFCMANHCTLLFLRYGSGLETTLILMFYRELLSTAFALISIQGSSEGVRILNLRRISNAILWFTSIELYFIILVHKLVWSWSSIKWALFWDFLAWKLLLENQIWFCFWWRISLNMTMRIVTGHNVVNEGENVR